MNQNQNREDVDRLSGCLFAVLSRLGGSVRIKKSEMEALSPEFHIAVHVEKESGDVIISATSHQGEAN